MPYILAAALFAFVVAGAGKKTGKKKITQGNAVLKAGRPYRIELQVDTPMLQTKPQDVATAFDNYLRMNGAFDVLVQPSIPLFVSYTIITQGDVPVVLNVPVAQTLGGVAGNYTFLSVQELASAPRAAA